MVKLIRIEFVRNIELLREIRSLANVIGAYVAKWQLQ